MNNILLIDYGATRIKSMCVDIDDNIIIDSIEIPSPSIINYSNDPNRFEIPAIKYAEAFNIIVNKFNNINAICICSEMHGFVYNDTYISWKDQRSFIDEIDREKFLLTTGMILRKGLPYSILYNIKSKTKFKFYTLIDYILEKNNVKDLHSSYTLAASTGLINVHSKTWIEDFNYLDFFPISKNEILGTYNSIPIYFGLGDLQSALIGSNIGIDANAVINLGTGSQVAVLTSDINGFEIRPLNHNTFVKVQTHIPCGRALNIISRFIDSIGYNGQFWKLWNNLSVDEILSTDSTSDLNFFESARDYSNHSGHISLRESSCTISNVLPSIARNFIQQYINSLNLLDSNFNIHKVVVSGNISRITKFILPALNALDEKRSYTTIDLATNEETLDGLLKQLRKKNNDNSTW